MTRKLLIGTLFASLLAAGGTAMAQPVGPAPLRYSPARPAPYVAARPAPYVAARPAPYVAAPAAPYVAPYDGAIQRRYGAWTSLGQVVLAGRFDRGGDTLYVGRQAGPLTRLRLVALDGNPIVRAVRVTFGNGETVVIDLRGRFFRRGAAAIDLPGRARAVRSVELLAQNRGRFEGGRIEVLGERARFGALR